MDKIKVTLDTSAIDWVENKQFLEELARMQEKDQITIYVSHRVRLEKRRFENKSQREAELEWIWWHGHTYPSVFFINGSEDVLEQIEKARGYKLSDEERAFAKIRESHSPELKNGFPKDMNVKKMINKYNDWEILCDHVMNRGDFFITSDFLGFVNCGTKEEGKEKRLEQLKETFPNLKILKPNFSTIEIIKSIKSK